MILSNVVSVKSKNGLHLRPAGILSQIASKKEYLDLGIFLIYNGIRADVKSVFNLIGLGTFHGANLILEIEYEESHIQEAKNALNEISNWFDSGYEEAEVGYQK